MDATDSIDSLGWIRDAVTAGLDEAVDTRRWLHAHPEVSFAEHATTDAINERLLEVGLTTETCPTPTGAVATLEGGQPGRTVLVRADIDGLPVHEETPETFRSTNDGAMHACGHDAHVAILLTVARLMTARAEALPGRYVFVFQPAEERVSGARAMLDAGLLDGRSVDACIGCHVTPELPVGLLAMRPGIAMAAAHGFKVRLHGSGGHGATSTREGNVVLAVSALAPQLPGVVSGMRYEGSDCACSTGMINAGTAPNVVPQHAELEGSLRTYTAEQTADARAALEAVVAATAADFAVEAEVEITYDTPPVTNDPAATATVRGAAESILMNPDRVLTIPPVSPSDDMSEFLLRAPGCYFYVGAGSPDHPSGPHHSPTFALDEGCLESGALSMAAGAITLAT
jgi:amidohydrolase